MINPYFRIIFLFFFFSNLAFANICENIQTKLATLPVDKNQQIQGIQGMVLANDELYFLLRMGETFTKTQTSLMRLNVDNDKKIEWIPDLLSTFKQLPSEQIKGVSLVPQGFPKNETVLLPLYAEARSSTIAIQGLQAGDVLFLLDVKETGKARQAISVYRNLGSRFQWLQSTWNTAQSKIQISIQKPGQWAILPEKTPNLNALGIALMPLKTGIKLLSTTAFNPSQEDNKTQVAYNFYQSVRVDTQDLAEVQPWLKYQDDNITALTLSKNAKIILIGGRSKTVSPHQGEVSIQCIAATNTTQKRKSIVSRLGDGTQVAFLVHKSKAVQGITVGSGDLKELTNKEGKFRYKLGIEPNFYIGQKETGIFLGQGKPEPDPKDKSRNLISFANLITPDDLAITKRTNMERLLRVLDKNEQLADGIVLEKETLALVNQQKLNDKINFANALDVFAKADSINQLLDNLTPHFNKRRQIIPPTVVTVSTGGGTPSPYIETRRQALKLLRQAAFVSTESEIEFIRLFGDEAWIKKQLALPSDLDPPVPVDPLVPVNPATPTKPVVVKLGYLKSLLKLLTEANPSRYPKAMIDDPFNNLEEYNDKDRFKFLAQSVWWQKALHNEDQLRQRVAYALSQLLVISNESPAGAALNHRGEAMAVYYDILLKNSFGNYRTLLKEVSLSAAMSYYLTYVGNKKAGTKSAPDENYARELMQLFTIGLYELNLDGTRKLSADKSLPIPTYTQQDVSELARVFTGWDWQDRNDSSKYGSTSYRDNSLVVPIEFNQSYHDFGSKNVLGKTIPSGLSGEKDIDAALDILFANPNIALHVSKHLIMRLVTSNPTAAYVERVAKVFNDNGKGVKGDLKATVEAILTDPEARDPAARIKALQELAAKNPDPLKPTKIVDNFGKVDEFLLATTHFLGAFNVRPLPVWRYWNPNPRSKIVNLIDTYWFTPQAYYPQVPLQAESVFNFYNPEFIPSDKYFVTNKLVAPELQIRNNNGLLGFSGLLYSLLNYEKYHLIDLGYHNKAKAEDMVAWATDNNKDRFDDNNLYLDLTPLYNLFEQQLDGNANGDFTNMANSGRKLAAINALINYLDEHLLGNSLPADYRTQLKEHLFTITSKDPKENAYFIISTAIRAIVSSPLYMVLD